MKKEQGTQDMRQVAAMLKDIATRTGSTVIFYWEDDERIVNTMCGKRFDCIAALGRLTEILFSDEDDEK